MDTDLTIKDITKGFIALVTRFESPNDLAVELLQHEQVSCPVYHHFYPGIYMREVFFPKGSFAIGHKQKLPQLNLFLKGRLIMFNTDGTTAEIKAPMVFMGEAGQKMGYAVEDVSWINVYPTTETDVEKLEEMYLEKVPGFAEKTFDRWEDRNDYQEFLKQAGLTDEVIRAETEITTNIIPFPAGTYAVMVADSDINGKGLFATANFKPGDVIAPARLEMMRTPAGRYTNHALNPNAEFQLFGDNVYLVAKREIAGMRGGYHGEEITVDYREVLRNLHKQEI